MAQEQVQMSEELAALVQRAERAAALAQDLLVENERWRKRALQQLEYMFELGAEFRKAGHMNYSRPDTELLA
jgi:hypothetical protein